MNDAMLEAMLFLGALAFWSTSYFGHGLNTSSLRIWVPVYILEKKDVQHRTDERGHCLEMLWGNILRNKNMTFFGPFF